MSQKTLSKSAEKRLESNIKKISKKNNILEIELQCGTKTLIDKSNESLLNEFPYWVMRGNYVRVTRFIPTEYGVVQQMLALSRLIVMREIGLEQMIGMCVDHIDGNPLNNKKSNLRLATNSENSSNKKSKNKTGYRGVTYVENKKAYTVMAKKKGDTKYFYGYYKTAIEAAKAYDKIAKEKWGDFAVLNFK